VRPDDVEGISLAAARSVKTTAAILSALALCTLSARALAQSKDPGWPRQIEHDHDRLVYYQPQVEDWKQGATQLSGRFAVELTPRDATKPDIGVVWVEARTTTDLVNRTVTLDDVKVQRALFRQADRASQERAERLAKEMFPKGSITISLDRLIADVARTKQASRQIAVKNEPPQIFASQKLAVLLQFDGKPVFVPVERSSSLEYAVNTNFTVFHDPTTQGYYMLDGKTWLRASDVKGPWAMTAQLPKQVFALPESKNWQDVRASLPPKAAPADKVPLVFMSTKPAEIIVIEGAPRLEAIPHTALEYVANTESDVFFYRPSKTFYYLVAGRWFSATSLQGPWKFATPTLPKDFAHIPPDSKMGRVLVSVPGTAEAKHAALEAEIPRMATIDRKSAKVEVSYAGKPQFKPIEGTSMKYAVNTSYDVIEIGSPYYVCYQGVWFSGPSPTGPFAVVDQVPQVIYTIPPSSPIFPVTYVNVYASTPSTVTFGYTLGYVGGVVTAGLLTWGTGYWYPPFVGTGLYGAAYFAHPYTFGAGVYYNRFASSFYRGGAAYGPYGGIAAGARYNPATGTYARGAAAYGPYGAGAAAHAYNPRTGVGAASYQRSTPYGQWGRSVAAGPHGGAVETGHYTGARGTVSGARTSWGGEAVHTSEGGTLARGPDNNLYATKDGNVYRNTGGGGWQHYGGGGWGSAERQPVSGAERSDFGDLDRSAYARSEGALSADRFNGWRAGGGAARFGGGGFHGFGGGFHGRR
jgi:hypothetical protein